MHVQEINEVGPVTEEVFEATRMQRNLQAFMRSEAFTSEEVKDMSHRVKNKNNELLLKSVRRW